MTSVLLFLLATFAFGAAAGRVGHGGAAPWALVGLTAAIGSWVFQ